MIKRISLLIVAALVATTMVVVAATPLFALPQCPEGTTAQKGPKGTFTCVENEPQKNTKKTEQQTETFKGSPNANKSQGEQETSCTMQTGSGTKTKEGPCPGGQEPA